MLFDLPTKQAYLLIGRGKGLVEAGDSVLDEGDIAVRGLVELHEEPAYLLADVGDLGFGARCAAHPVAEKDVNQQQPAEIHDEQ